MLTATEDKDNNLNKAVRIHIYTISGMANNIMFYSQNYFERSKISHHRTAILRLNLYMKEIYCETDFCLIKPKCVPIF